MDWLSDFKGRVEENVPLSGLTWFKLGGQADYVVSPGGESQLGQLVRRAESMGIPLRVLGGGPTC